jgi:glycerate-2-kinase
MKSQRRLRSDVARIWTAALRAVDPAAAVRKAVKRDRHELIIGRRRFDLDNANRIWILGAGKAAGPMAQALEKILGDRLTGGLRVTATACHCANWS